MVYCVGLTGGIASGKSTVAKLFASLGIHVISADHIAKELTAKNQQAYHDIVARYGDLILQKNTELDRKQLRTIIFTHKEERKWIEQLLHPLIRQQIEKEVTHCTTPYCIVEIPLLTDKKNYPYIDSILLITASVEMQIARVMYRDQCSEKQALAILEAQPDISSRLKNADKVLQNNGSMSELKVAVKTLHLEYLQQTSLK